MPGTRLSTADVVRSLINLLDRAAERSPSSSGAVLVRVDRLPATSEDHVQFALYRLPEDVHPLSALEGFVAPPAWAGLGLVAHGRVQPMGEPGPLGDACGRGRVVIVLLRDGTLGSGLRLPDDAAMHVRVGPAGSGPVGRIPLALCRALGVPCAAEPADPTGDP